MVYVGNYHYRTFPLFINNWKVISLVYYMKRTEAVSSWTCVLILFDNHLTLLLFFAFPEFSGEVNVSAVIDWCAACEGLSSLKQDDQTQLKEHTPVFFQKVTHTI